MAASIDPGLRQARQSIIDAHSAAETAHDLDAVIATFHHPRYEIVPTGEVFDGEVIRESKKIVEWARDNPASGAERASGQVGGEGAATTT